MTEQAMADEYTCRDCGHQFPGPPFSEALGLTCPRCGGVGLDRNPWLLGSPGVDGLTEQDYYDAYFVP